QLDLLSTSNASKVPATLLPNLLRYTSFEGTGGEWDTGLTSVRALAGNTATNGLTGTAQHRTFPYLGENYILLNANNSTNYPRLVMDAVPLDCDYSDLEVCVRFARPVDNAQATMPIFDSNDSLRLIMTYFDGLTFTNDTIAAVYGTALETASEKYTRICASTTPPVGVISSQLTIELTGDSSEEDLFIDEVYLTGTPVNPVTAAFTPTVTDLTVDFNAGASTNTSFYFWLYGDGTPLSGPFLTPITSHTYAMPGIYTTCLLALDPCGNAPTVTCEDVILTAALPVSWLSFAATAEADAVYLRWQTSAEEDNDYFAVEWSTDGRSFTEIGQVKGAGTIAEVQAYDYPHRPPVAGAQYYRLRQVDFDGTVDYSPVRRVDWGRLRADWQVFPNPATDQITLQPPYPLAGETVICRIFDSQGRLLLDQPYRPGQSLPINEFRGGLYYLQIYDPASSQHWRTKFLKQ
ncbi:MAG: T9SS type A sorting domain-containing protein, partial [Lewinella sp.]|nr:T9SS type A sorting domain-containing protein [Lewinella sp.]